MTSAPTERRLFRRLGATLPLLFALAATAAETIRFDASELERIAAHGPWPLQWAPDPGNRVSASAAAIRLGHDLFFDPRLSASRGVSCATCHDPARGFQDGRATARGLATGIRNTPGLFNVRHQRWFGWDGGHDSLWAASLRPILDPREMGGQRGTRGANPARHRPALECHYTQAFGKPPDADDPQLLVNVAKAIAAWQETLVSPPTAFDRFRDALAARRWAGCGAYPAAAQRGLKPVPRPRPVRHLPCRAAIHQRRIRRHRRALLHQAGGRRSGPPGRHQAPAGESRTTCSAPITTTPRETMPREPDTCGPNIATSASSRCRRCAT
jgi:hypothetical protein